MHIRKCHVAGTFYDAHAQNLSASVQQALAQAKKNCTDLASEAHMVLLPHAGHFFCGHIIAETLAAVRLPQKLILLCPNHTGLGTAPSGIAVWGKGHWQSPLANIPIDEALAQKIMQSDGAFAMDEAAHTKEHSLEVLLPFLYHAVPNFSMVPICVGTGHFEQLKKAGLVLANIIHEQKQQGQDIAIVLSSDMHHFSSHERTVELDNLALNALEELDPIKLYNIVKQEKISMCGIYPAIMALYACKALGAKRCKLISHTTSYEKSMDSTRTVGYAGLFVPKNTC